MKKLIATVCVFISYIFGLWSLVNATYLSFERWNIYLSYKYMFFGVLNFYSERDFTIFIWLHITVDIIITIFDVCMNMLTTQVEVLEGTLFFFCPYFSTLWSNTSHQLKWELSKLMPAHRKTYENAPISIRSTCVFWPFQLNLESLHTNLEAIHGLDGCLCTRWVVEAYKPKTFALICSPVDENFGAYDVSKWQEHLH